MAFAAFSHGGGGGKKVAAPVSKGSGKVALLLLLPGLMYLAVFFIAPPVFADCNLVANHGHLIWFPGLQLWF